MNNLDAFAFWEFSNGNGMDVPRVKLLSHGKEKTDNTHYKDSRLIISIEIKHVNKLHTTEQNRNCFSKNLAFPEQMFSLCFKVIT